MNNMKELKPIESIDFFKSNLPVFLSKDPSIQELISNVRTSLENKTSDDLQANLLESGKRLIKHIITKSMEFLSDEGGSPKSNSIAKIEKYIDTFTVFEEMLFGLDQSYRDHTLHSLWVYLFGHEFIVSMGGYETIVISGQMQITYYSKDKIPKFNLFAASQEGTLPHLEAMWGMIAILHDLGYPIEAISSKPEEVFGRILDPFAVDFNSVFHVELTSRISLLHQSICDLLSTMYRPAFLTSDESDKYFKEADEKGKFLNIPREPTISKDEAREAEFKIASVDKIHSAWSVILAFKNINYLHESDYRGGGNRDYLKLLTRRDILNSILHHTSEEPEDAAVNRFQFILLLMDDIEEAARYSRGGRLRGLVSDFCDIRWHISKTVAEIELDYANYEYDVEKKYSEMSNKYKAQISDDKDRKYVISIRFTGKTFKNDLNLCLAKDK
jgi:hypothetical protein